METTIDSIGDDLLHNILSRLPALACANAACVSRPWNLIISSLLSSPNLSYARSFCPSLQITGKLGSRILIITLVYQGIFGRNAVNDEFEEVQWDFIENEEACPNRGVSLTVDFRGTQALMIDELVLNIRACSLSVSDVASPAAILLFSDHETCSSKVGLCLLSRDCHCG